MAKKIPVSIRMEEDVIERLRNAVWHLGRGLTVTSVIEEAVGKAVRDLEKQKNSGKPYTVRRSPLVRARR